MERALHLDLAKPGVSVDGDGRVVTESMSAPDMIGWTRAGEGIARKPADFRYQVIVGDVYREVATVTVHSAIFREYLHLINTADGWKIRNALYTTVVDGLA